MTLTLTWNGTTLANPSEDGEIGFEREFIGSTDRMLDGTLRADIMAEKAVITVPWAGLSAAEKATLRTAYTTNYTTATNLVISNGTTSQTFSVMAVNGWSEQVWYDRNSADYYNVTIRFTEV